MRVCHFIYLLWLKHIVDVARGALNELIYVNMDTEENSWNNTTG